LSSHDGLNYETSLEDPSKSLSGKSPARIFISYSRKDGMSFARDVRRSLLERDLSVWQDIIALEGGQHWWSQIENALRSKALQHFVLIVTPAALESRVVRREIRLARQEGKTVLPIKGPDLRELNKLPRWLGQLYDFDIPEQFTVLIRVLQDQSRQKRVAMMAPKPPADWVARPAEFDALKRMLLDAKGDAVTISVALEGAGGYGKTTLAKALADDLDIQEAYFDGILWVELGERSEDVRSKLTDLIEILTDDRPGLESINAIAAKLSEALGDRRILLIIDDVWRDQDLSPFLRRGSKTTRLITTRDDHVLPDDVEWQRQRIYLMKDDEALTLLAWGLGDQAASQRLELGKLARRLGEWPLLLKIVNGFLRDRLTTGQSLREAVVGVNKRLDAKGLVAFDAHNDADRNKAVARTIGVSLESLDPSTHARFNELGIFPEDAEVPIGIVSKLWAETGSLKEFEAEDLLSDLYKLSLLVNLDLDQRTVRLHDTIRDFLRNQAGEESLVAQNKRLLRAIDGVGESGQADTLTGRYFYLRRLYHLAEAGDRDTLDTLLLDPDWLESKLAATGNPQTLIADYDQYGLGEAQRLIGRTLQLTAGIVARDQRQLMPQLLCRLMACQSVAATGFLHRARRILSSPAILTRRASLTPPGVQTGRLEGHSAPVRVLCALPDGRLASGSSDNTIRLWDLTRRTAIACLKGHWEPVRALSLLLDGRLASASDDDTIRLWDLSNGAETARIAAHLVTVLCVLPDGRLASGSGDSTVRLWDVASGAEAARLEDAGRVAALCVLPDGRLAAGSIDHTIGLWDVTTGVETARLKGHTGSVTALCALSDGRLASSSADSTIRLWNATTGVQTGRLEGHSRQVTALCVLPDGRLASGSHDKTLRLWNVTTGAETARYCDYPGWETPLCVLLDGRLALGSTCTIELWDVATGHEITSRQGHSYSTRALCTLPDGRLAAGYGDGTIRLWDVTTDAEIRLAGHLDSIEALCVLPDGRLASGSEDKTIRLWDLMTGAEITRLVGHSDSVTALCVLPDGRLASGSEDKTIRLWDLTSGAETARLEGHVDWLTTLCMLPDGRLASGSRDNLLRLWDVTTGAAIACLEGHSDCVTALCVLPNGWLASSSDDKTIRLWDVTGGAKTVRLEGHAGGINVLCVPPDGRLASAGSDRTIRLWDIAAEREVARLEVGASVECLVVLGDASLGAGDYLGRLHLLEIVN
jgi:WD40 repeat protein